MNSSKYERYEIDFCIVGKTTIRRGQRIYNRGDMANPDHFGTVTKIDKQDAFGINVEITPDSDSDRKPYNISLVCISDIDQGNGLTRIVTIEAYEKYRAERIGSWKSILKQ